MTIKVYDTKEYKWGEVIDTQVLDNGEEWMLVRWDCSPHYPDWYQILPGKYRFRLH